MKRRRRDPAQARYSHAARKRSTQRRESYSNTQAERDRDKERDRPITRGGECKERDRQ